MGVTLDTPPVESLEALRAVLPSLPDREALVLEGLASAGGPVEAELPHLIESVRLEALAHGDGLQSVEPIGWRYLPRNLPDAAVEVLSNGPGGGHEFSEINRGPYVEATRATLAHAEADPAVEAGDYRVTLLRIPALYVMALWFHAQGGGEDLIFPIPPVPAELEADRAYRVAEFEEVLREPARQRAAFDDRPQPDS